MKRFLIIVFLIAGLLTKSNGVELDCNLIVSKPVGQTNHQITNEKVINCSKASVVWNYPTNNLTIVFSTPKSNSFQLCLRNSISIYSDILVYRKENDQEVKVLKNSNNVCMESDIGKKLTLKLVAPSKLIYYGVLVRYTLI